MTTIQHNRFYYYITYVCVCVCACVRARARAGVCVCIYGHTFEPLHGHPQAVKIYKNKNYNCKISYLLREFGFMGGAKETKDIYNSTKNK
jgi:hypothetical protein